MGSTISMSHHQNSKSYPGEVTDCSQVDEEPLALAVDPPMSDCLRQFKKLESLSPKNYRSIDGIVDSLSLWMPLSGDRERMDAYVTRFLTTNQYSVYLYDIDDDDLKEKLSISRDPQRIPSLRSSVTASSLLDMNPGSYYRRKLHKLWSSHKDCSKVDFVVMVTTLWLFLHYIEARFRDWPYLRLLELGAQLSFGRVKTKGKRMKLVVQFGASP